MESCFWVADASEGQITGIDNFSFGMVGGQEGGEGRGGGGGGGGGGGEEEDIVNEVLYCLHTVFHRNS